MNKSVIKILSIFILLILTGSCVSEQTDIENPLHVELGDPYILKASDGMYYMVGTGGIRNGFKMYSSKNLKTWKNEGRIYRGNTKKSWGVSHFWAPELYEHQGKFYLVYSANWRKNPENKQENFRIGIAVSDDPTGPYTDINNRPLFDPGYPVIDGNLLFDEGRIYLYFSRCCYEHPVESEIADWAREKGLFDEIEESWVYGVELKSDFSGITGDPKLLLRPPVSMVDPQAEWESRSVTSDEINRRWTEGSYIFKTKGRYYMMYSSNYFGGENYAVGYATSDSPMGPFRKADNNPVLQKNTGIGGKVSGTGHNSVTLSPDGEQMLCVYHGRTVQTGNQRVVFIDPMEILEDGTLVVHGPTTSDRQLRRMKK